MPKISTVINRWLVDKSSARYDRGSSRFLFSFGSERRMPFHQATRTRRHDLRGGKAMRSFGRSHRGRRMF